MKVLTRAPLVLIPLLLIAACGDSDDNDAFTGPVTPLTEVPEIWGQAICEAYQNCAGRLLDIYMPGEDCADRFAAQVGEELDRIQEAIDAGRAVYDGRQIQACADEIRTKDCDGLLVRESPFCDAALDGTVEIGGACTMSTECKGTAYCNFSAACPGVCAALEPAGGACRSDGNCSSGLDCSDATEHCVEPAGPGDLCGAGEPDCKPGFICAGANEDNATPGNCRTYDEVLAAGNGDPCDPITGELCDTEFVCVIESASATTGIVATCMPNVAAGADCGAAFPDQCPDDEYCMIAADSLTGTCQPKPGVGDPCGVPPFETEGSVCAANLRCNNGNCRELATLGESCTSDDACLSDTCLDGACVSGGSCE